MVSLQTYQPSVLALRLFRDFCLWLIIQQLDKSDNSARLTQDFASLAWYLRPTSIVGLQNQIKLEWPGRYRVWNT